MNQLIFDVHYPHLVEKTIMKGYDNAGNSIGANEQYLTKNEKPWLPIMAEFHFTRYSQEDWELELRKMKACGIDIVASYLFWIFHEERRGIYNFTGNRDISLFLKLCKKVGLYAFIRIGPWCHGECRNGGFPDWVQHSGLPLRSCNDSYLKLVRKLFKAYAAEINPWLYENGGPVIGIQLENELVGNAEYLSALKKIALECGMRTPLYTVTGWGNNMQLPYGEVLPTYGAYPAGPWTEHCEPLPPSEHYLFSPLRNDINIGSDQLKPRVNENKLPTTKTPFLTCEIGPGNQCTYHRRPVISPMDAVALTLAKIGAGNNLPGYYMFHGGFNPPEGLYQESKDTGYPNDLPVSSYDFQAPLGEYGQPRASYFYLKMLHQFIQCCGEKLAVMESFFPNLQPKDSSDTKTPRLALRSDGDAGFLFYNTHQRGLESHPIRDLIVTVHTPNNGTREYGPLNIPADSCGVFPLEQNWYGASVAFMAMQPLWAGIYDGMPTLVCTAFDGIASVIELRGKWNVTCETGKVEYTTENITKVSGFSTENSNRIIVCRDEVQLQIIPLSEKRAQHFYPIQIDGMPRFVFSSGIAFEDEGDILALEGTNRTLEYKNDVRITADSEKKILADNFYAKYLFEAPQNCPEFILQVPQKLIEAFYDTLLVFNVEANVLQLYAGQELIADEFIRGEPWTVSVRRMRPYIDAGQQLRLKCSPLHKEQKIYLERPIKRECVEVELSEVITVSIRKECAK